MSQSRCRHRMLMPGILFVGMLAALPAYAGCALDTEPRQSHQHWKAQGFPVADAGGRGKRALQLADCLGNPDPFLRDGIAFEALSKWMRGKQLDADTLRALQSRLQAQLEGADANGFRKPFAALVLSEVARTDRVQPWMTADERARMVTAAAAYLQSVRDYRGYVDTQGWRHGVAHGADWALQLVLNKAVDAAQLQRLLDAIAAQIMPRDGHAYAHGEPVRLARPVAYAVSRGDVPQSVIDAWLAGLSTALGKAPEGTQQAVWWSRRSNLENFLHALAYQVDGQEAPALVGLAASIRNTMKQLP